MKATKERLTVTVDAALLKAGQDAVASGRAESLSAWVNLALAERLAREQRLCAMRDAIAAYEAGFGVITAEELAVQQRADRRSARFVRSAAPAARKAPRTRRRGAA